MLQFNRHYLQLIRKPVHFVSFGFGSGLCTPAPGTWGSGLALLLIWPATTLLSFWWFFAATIGCTLLGIWCSEQTANAMAIPDPGAIVIDEFAGMMVGSMPLWWLPAGSLFTGLSGLIVVFILFRIFDILKPGPIKWADQRFNGGFGIMFDDLLAGLATAFTLLGLAQVQSYFA